MFQALCDGHQSATANKMDGELCLKGACILEQCHLIEFSVVLYPLPTVVPPATYGY